MVKYCGLDTKIMEDILNALRILSYMIISLIFLWRFVYSPNKRILSFLLSMAYTNAILVSHAILTKGDPSFWRNFQTIWVVLIAITLLTGLVKDLRHMRIKHSLEGRYEIF